jgi:hypothetical protein
LAVADIESPSFVIAFAYKFAEAVYLVEDIANFNALIKSVKYGRE